MNGVTEALVKSTKKALNAAVGDQIMDFSELQTVMYEAAQIVNQRPIGKHPLIQMMEVTSVQTTCYLVDLPQKSCKAHSSKESATDKGSTSFSR